MLLTEEYKLALLAAKEASEAILTIYEGDILTEMKIDGSPVTQADLLSSNIINEHLEKTGIPITGEENEHQSFEIRKDWERSWCVDPLDGTKEFIKRNGEFAVNIALIEGHQAVFGIIAWPVKGEILFGGNSMGVFISDLNDIRNPEKWVQIKEAKIVNDPITVTCSRSHHSGPVLNFLNQVKEKESNLEFLKMGSAIKFFALAKGEADTYPRFAPTMEWDIAAGQAILEALGGSVIHAETGEPLYYNKENLRNPYFIASTKAFLEWYA